MRRSLGFLSAGQPRRAASSLLRGIHEPTAEIIEQLRRLHLPPPLNPISACPLEAPSPSFSSAAVRAFLRERAPHGSAPGLSGWTESLLLPLAEDPVLLLSLTTFLEDIAGGRVDRSSRTRLLACRLIPAKKKDGGVRPIAVSEIFLRAASSLALRLLPAGTLSRLLAPLQLGVKGIIHRVQSSILIMSF